MTDFQKVIFIAALFGFGAVFLSTFVTQLTFIPDSLEPYAQIVVAIILFVVVAYIAKRIGVHFY
jgi:Kef-type K+ transport system membrane component KefB